MRACICETKRGGTTLQVEGTGGGEGTTKALGVRARAQLMGLAIKPVGAATLLGAQRDEGL